MILFALGIIIGILLSIVSMLISLYFKPQIERSIKQLDSTFKPKGAILEPKDETVEAWLESLKTE